MEQLAERSFQDVVLALLRERGWSQKHLARTACVDPGFLCRVLGNRSGVSAELASRVAVELELPPDFFAEYREREVIQAIRSDPVLRDRVYEALRRDRS